MHSCLPLPLPPPSPLQIPPQRTDSKALTKSSNLLYPHLLEIAEHDFWAGAADRGGAYGASGQGCGDGDVEAGTGRRREISGRVCDVEELAYYCY